MGGNINGPSLIRVPAWVDRPLGRYYLYFADHKGSYIRLAFAETVEGPWRVHGPGCLDVARSRFCAVRPQVPGPPPDWARDGQDWLYPHVASPDVHVEEDERRIRMYVHGLLANGDQMTRVALSRDGVAFEVLPDLLGPPYFRAFHHGGWWYAIAYPNQLLRSADGLTAFEAGPTPLEPRTRHTAVLVVGDTLHVFWTRLGDRPERILHGTIDLAADWRDWRLCGADEVLRPELAWEGADLPIRPSRPGAAAAPENALRDPFVFDDGGAGYLFYCGGGESAIGLAALDPA